MKPSQNALQLIKNREQCRLTSYKLAGEDYYTIGWGHLCDRSNPLNAQYNKAGARITQAQADAFLAQDVARSAKAVDDYLKVAVNQNTYDALVSISYNYNPATVFKKGLFRLINLGFPATSIATGFMGFGTYDRFLQKCRKADVHLLLNGVVKSPHSFSV